MSDQSGLQRSNKERSKDARERALQAVISLESQKKAVNFSAVAAVSGVARSFLYADEQSRKMIEEHRKKSVSDEMNRRARFDKTSRLKDVIIEAKDKRIATLMAENEKLKAEIALLRGMLYADKDSITSRTCSRREETSNSGG
jgi:N-acetyl-beta-hexosaminidase